ncbi:hypothetical protein ABB02_01557 [Clostridiaceae bacterium JG1575]|nr:hypothetical protein ABB02_01557 [Clostridiaceae bacterium JG1575]
MIYVVENSMEGFFTALYHHLKIEPCEGILREQDARASLLEAPKALPSDNALARRVREGLREKLGSKERSLMNYLLLYNDSQSFTWALQVTLFALSYGPGAADVLQHPAVLRATKCQQAVRKEAHRMKGFLRFQCVEQVMIAVMEPDHDILELLAPHFRQRMDHHPYLIVDAKRQKALLIQDQKCLVQKNVRLPDGLQQEDPYEALWRSYVDHLAIVSRRNPKAQDRLVPRRYRGHMTEFQ